MSGVFFPTDPVLPFDLSTFLGSDDTQESLKFLGNDDMGGLGDAGLSWDFTTDFFMRAPIPEGDGPTSP